MTRRYHAPALPRPGERATLPLDTSHHLLEVCRHPRGEPLSLFDGAGREMHCRLIGVDGRQAVVEGLEELPACQPRRRVTLLLALCKHQAWETALRMATELGVDEVQPVRTERCTVRKLRPQRWQKVLVSACAQSGRRWLPALAELAPLPRALQAPSLPSRRLVLAPGTPRGPECSQGDLALLVGPEGGLTSNELDLARQAGFEPAGLCPHVLRVDTAVAAALALYG